jgi:hypothetical protein
LIYQTFDIHDQTEYRRHQMIASTPAASALPEIASPTLAPDLPGPLSLPLPVPAEILAPASTAGDHYLVIARHRAGNYAPEREETDLVSREQTIRDIYEGQIEEVARVVAFNPGRGTCRDATAEIARDVAGLHFTERTEPHWRRRDWLHKVLGPHQADLILGVRR